MPNSIQQEELIFTDTANSDDKDKAILGVLEGECADFMDATRNGRKYDESLWDKVFSDEIVTEMIENGGIPGELDHPVDREEIDSSRIAILLKEKPKKKNGKLWAKFHILNTPLGKIAYTLAKAGFKLGISSRGSGEVYQDYDGEHVDESSYDFKCFDLVLLPAVKSARLNLVTEGLNTNKFNFKKALQESLNSASKEDRKIMMEALDNLDIDIEDSSDIVSSVEDEFGVIYEPVEGSINWLLPDGKFLDLVGVSTDNDILEKLSNTSSVRFKNNELNVSIEEKLTDIQKNSLSSLLDLALSNVDKVNVTDRNKNIIGTITSDGDAISQFEEICNNPIKEELSKDTLSDNADVIDEVGKDEEVGNAEAELVEQLQSILVEKANLEEQVEQLQEKLSVCYAVEVKNGEKINNYKRAIDNLSAQSKKIEPLNQCISSLQEELKDLKTINKNLTNQLSETKEQIKESLSKSNRLNESLSSKDKKITSLQESLNSLNKKYSALEKTYNSEKESFNESLAELKKDSAIEHTQYVKKLSDSNSLVEKYKKIAKTAVDRYIGLQATRIGCSLQDVKSKLGENYSFNDIDRVCENLKNYKINISKLPFDVANTKKVSIKESKESKEITTPLSSDDIVDSQLLRMTGLK